MTVSLCVVQEPSPTEETEETVEPAAEAVPEGEAKPEASLAEEPAVPETRGRPDGGNTPENAPKATEEVGAPTIMKTTKRHKDYRRKHYGHSKIAGLCC